MLNLAEYRAPPIAWPTSAWAALVTGRRLSKDGSFQPGPALSGPDLSATGTECRCLSRANNVLRRFTARLSALLRSGADRRSAVPIPFSDPSPGWSMKATPLRRRAQQHFEAFTI